MRIWLASTMEWCNQTSKTDNIHQFFLRSKPCSPCVYALDIKFCKKKSILTIILMFDTKSGPQPPKIWKRVPAWYTRYPSAVWFTILHNSWGDVTTTRLSTVSLFRTWDIAMLRSKQIQDPDNRVSDPTDRVVKPDFNRSRIMLGIVPKCWCANLWRISDPWTQNSQMFSWWNDHRSVNCNGHRTRSGTCGLVHKPSLTPHFNLAWETRPIYAGCFALLTFLPCFLGSPIAPCAGHQRPGNWFFETQDAS